MRKVILGVMEGISMDVRKHQRGDYYHRRRIVMIVEIKNNNTVPLWEIPKIFLSMVITRM